MLKRFGIHRLLVETPSYMHYLVSQKLMDELFFNYSCIYVGGAGPHHRQIRPGVYQ